jgi:hypothetical protein
MASRERERLESQIQNNERLWTPLARLQTLTLPARPDLTLHKQERLRQASSLRPLHFSFTTVVRQSLV